MADVVKTCTNCGNAQKTGDFCEKCGTRLPSAVAAAAAPAAAATTPVEAPPAAQNAAYQVPPPPGVYQQGAYQQAAPPPYQYAAQPQAAAPKGPNPFENLFDLSFQKYVTRGSLKVLWISSLILLGVFFVLSLIFFAIAADGAAYWCIGIFSTLVLVALMLMWTRIMLELTMTVSKVREDSEKAGESKSSESKS